MPISYPNQDISAVDDNGNRSIGYKDPSGIFRAVSETDPLPTVSSPGTATPTSLISKISRFIGWSMFNATPSTRTEWQAGPLQSDALWNLLISLATRLAGEDITNNRQLTEIRCSGRYISTATTTQVKAGIGVLHTLVVQGGAAGTIIGYDSMTASGSVVFSFDSTNTPNTYTFDEEFVNGLTVVTSAATKITVNVR